MLTRPNSQDDAIVSEVLTKNCYALPDDLSGKVVLDLGAHIGSFARACLDRGAKSVTCLEPDWGNFNLLLENAPDAVCFHAAVAPTSAIAGGTVRFSAGTSDDGYEYTACGFIGVDGKSEIPATTLDGLLVDLRHVDLLKIDIESAEFGVLAEAKELARVGQIAMEVHAKSERDTKALASLLEKRGFTVEYQRDSFWGSEMLWNLWAWRGEPLCRPPTPEQRQLNVFIATFSYGGNGGFASEHPAVGRYLSALALKLEEDPRVGHFAIKDFVDTPITMTRNAAVLAARRWGADVLLMIDSDMTPDCELKEDSTAKPFWDSSFDYLYSHYTLGPVAIGAPYGGPPPMSNCYVFHWASWQNADEAVSRDMRIEAYSRDHAEIMSGIQDAAALPTGLILFDMRCFDLTDPKNTFEELISQGVSVSDARLQTRSWFYYEYADFYEAQKDSTEDVTATRDMAFAGQLKLGYCPIKCNWDAWAGHNKPLLVRKPRSLKLDQVNAKYKAAVLGGVSSRERIISVDYTSEVACG